MSGPRQMTQKEHEQGFAECECGKVHIFRSSVLKRLPKDYKGELCQDCNLWMCDKNKIIPEQPIENETI